MVLLGRDSVLERDVALKAPFSQVLCFELEDLEFCEDSNYLTCVPTFDYCSDSAEHYLSFKMQGKLGKTE